MKAQLTLVSKRSTKLLGLAFFIALFAFNPLFAQSTDTAQETRTIKGLISDEYGPLESVNVILKGTTSGTVTNSKGEFTFPKKLKTGDILLISYLGYKNVEVSINDDTTFVKLTLTQELIEFVGEVNSNKPYKSKRPKKTKTKN